MLLFHVVPALLSLALYSIPTFAAQPTLKKAFDVQVKLGAPVGPITIPGGVTFVEPITSGTITGSAFNGNITGASAVVAATSKGKVANPMVQIYGEADDGSPFIAYGTGVGEVGAQIARVVVEIEGKYAKLANEFILATFTDNDKNPPTKSNIEAWIVSRSD